ncbi:MAG TPA: response regulator, partial [Planctomycetes bacterium]|nr:response regulator [Planctomycetota bacterium]
PPTSKVILVMNHNRDSLDELTTALARQGFEVRIGESLAQSYRLAGEDQPDVVLLNPLVLCADGVELELLERMQKEDDPIPVILLVEDLAALADARNLAVPF